MNQKHEPPGYPLADISESELAQAVAAQDQGKAGLDQVISEMPDGVLGLFASKLCCMGCLLSLGLHSQELVLAITRARIGEELNRRAVVRLGLEEIDE